MALLRRGVGPARVRRLLLAFAPVWPERTPPAVALDALDAALGPDDVGAEDPPALALAATLALAAGRRAAARQHAAALARALPDAPAERAGALLALARVAWRADADAAGARRHLAEAERTAAGAAGLQAAIATFDGTLANEAEHDPARAEAAYRQALRLYAAEPTAHGHARRGLRYNLAITGIYAGRAAEALAELDSLLDEAAATGDRHLLAQVHNARGSALEALGRAEEAESATRRALAEAWATLETANGLYALWNLAPMALARGDAGRAARLLGFADRFWRTHFGALAPNDALDVARTRRRCRLRLGRAAGQRAWDEGAALPLAAAVALALDA
jgi:tetratricopeptide (TPR) repeat protein